MNFQHRLQLNFSLTNIYCKQFKGAQMWYWSSLVSPWNAQHRVRATTFVHCYCGHHNNNVQKCLSGIKEYTMIRKCVCAGGVYLLETLGGKSADCNSNLKACEQLWNPSRDMLLSMNKPYNSEENVVHKSPALIQDFLLKRTHRCGSSPAVLISLSSLGPCKNKKM